ncbi:MAG: dodecin flavoprotein [Dehalococcoidia bacterium]|nr:dodecin flavoprotein [Dehalococcoidia bacterium]
MTTDRPTEHVYKVEEIVGSSTTSIEDAITRALDRTAQTVRNLDWFEVREIRGTVDADAASKVGWFQVKLGIGFRVEDPS